MSLTHYNPETLYKPRGFSHAIVAEGTRIAFIGGQISTDLEGKIVGVDDYAAQGEQALRNFGAALAGAGVNIRNLAKFTIYVVNLTPETEEQMFDGFAKASHALGLGKSTTIVLGVQALGLPDALVEIDGIAVV